MAGGRATGIAGEQATGTIKNFQRIPGEMTATTIGEVKKVAHLDYAAQLKDFNLYVQQVGTAFNLYVRESAT